MNREQEGTRPVYKALFQNGDLSSRYLFKTVLPALLYSLALTISTKKGGVVPVIDTHSAHENTDFTLELLKSA